MASATIALAASSLQAKAEKPAAQLPLASVGMDKTDEGKTWRTVYRIRATPR